MSMDAELVAVLRLVDVIGVDEASEGVFVLPHLDGDERLEDGLTQVDELVVIRLADDWDRCPRGRRRRW